ILNYKELGIFFAKWRKSGIIMEFGFLIAPIIGGLVMENLGTGFVFYLAGLCGTIGVSVFFLFSFPISISKVNNDKFRLIFP
ncbi:MAG: hypothetical protein ACUVWV_15625, partial [Thermodesulfobacteriota bacterium]